MGDHHAPDEPDVVAERPVGTRSFVYGTKTLATAVVAIVLAVATDGRTAAAAWVLVSAGLLGVAFSLIERTTTRGAEVVNHARVNLDVVATAVLAIAVTVVVRLVG